MGILYISNIVKKNLTDNQINQIKNLIKLILRLFDQRQGGLIRSVLLVIIG